MSLDEIHAAIPHRAPFLLIDEILERDERRILCRKTFHEDEWYFAGHYPEFPITPGVLLCEAAMQAGAILLSQFAPPLEHAVPVAARMDDVRFKRMVRPGDTVEIEVELLEQISRVWYLSEVRSNGHVAVRFDFTCTVAPRPNGHLARSTNGLHEIPKAIARWFWTRALALPAVSRGPQARIQVLTPLQRGTCVRISSVAPTPDPLAPDPMDFLQLADKTILVLGVANRKSLAFHVGTLLEAAGARIVYSVRSAERRASVARLLKPEAEIHVCDVEHEEQIKALAAAVAAKHPRIDGLIHSIAFADYTDRPRAFHDTPKEAFLRAVDVSCYSLIALSNAFREQFDPDASVVATSISTTRMAAENYGFMAPVKAALDSSLAFLAKSFSSFSRVRFNAVAPGLLKTSASAGIPGYVDSYLYAEQVTLRKRAVQTEEAAAAAVFLLSPRASGINAQTLVVDAGMSVNYFDRDLTRRALKPE